MPKVLDLPIRRCRPSEDVDRMELSRDVEISRREFAEGKGIPHEQVMRESREMIMRWIEEDRARAAL